MNKNRTVRLVSIHDVLTHREALSDPTAARVEFVDYIGIREHVLAERLMAREQLLDAIRQSRRPRRRRSSRRCTG